MRSKTKKPKHRIHHHIKKTSEKAVHKAKKLFGFKYPKIVSLIILIVFAYYIFRRPAVSSWILNLDNLNYLGIFIAGIFISFGFSAPFSVGFFIISQPQNILVATLIGGIGAMISDLFIFKSIKSSFMNEFEELKKTKTIKKIRKIIKNNKHILIKHYLLYAFAGVMIMTPLPDEIGVSMLAGLTTIKPSRLAMISFVLHSLAIFLILYLSLGL